MVEDITLNDIINNIKNHIVEFITEDKQINKIENKII